MPSQKGSRRFGKPKKPMPCEQSRKCITCGKMLPAGVRYCVSCGTHDEVELDSRIADLDEQVKRSRERNFMLIWLSRLSFGLWRI
jgi:hypothetical protein